MTHNTKETKEKLIFSSVNEQITKETKEISSVSLVIVLEGGGLKSFSLVSSVSSVKCNSINQLYLIQIHILQWWFIISDP